MRDAHARFKMRAMRTRWDAPLAPGEVALVGAGPGAPELLTLAAVRLLADCDAVVYDALVPKEVLALAAPNAARIFAGKRGGRPSTAQEDITRTLIALARANKRVVRLKGGDPLLFARGGEELRALAEAGVRVRVVPGITAASAAAAALGVPLTDRRVNASLAFITAREAADPSKVDWKALVRAFPVIAAYMASAALPGLAARLRRAGMPADTPVALARAVGWEEETHATGTLAEAEAGKLWLPAPLVALIGDVVRLRTPWRRD